MTDSIREDREKLLAFFDRLVSQKKTVESGQTPCRNIHAKGVLEDLIGTEIPEEGKGFEGALAAYEALESVSSKWKHPLFFGYFPTTISEAALIGGTIQSLYPAYNSTLEVNEEESKLEMAVTDYVCDLLKLPEKFKWANGGVGLVMTTTGNSSVHSVHVAKHKKLKDLGLGAADVSRLVGYYPAYAHSHCIKALVLNGVIETRKVPLVYSEEAGNFQMDIEVLEKWMKEDEEKGLLPFITFAALGATSCCGVDPLRKVADICKKHGALMATDAAYSGAFMLNDKYKDIRESIEVTDFYMINLTKTGYCGAETSVLFHSQKAAHLSSLNLGDGEGKAANEYKLGTDTKTGVLRMYFTFSCVSQAEFAAQLKSLEDAADKLSEMLVEANSERFERFPPNTNYGLLCMRGKFDKVEIADETERMNYKNQKNRELLSRVMQQDWLYILGAENNNEYYIRLSCKSASHIELYQKLVEVFIKAYDEMIAEETAPKVSDS